MRFNFFESWLMFADARPPSKDLDEYAGFLMKDLARLEEFLDNPVPKRTLMDFVPQVFSPLIAGQLSKSQLAWIEELYRRVLQAGGAGTTYVQEQLIELLALSQDHGSIPFWLELLDYQSPRRDSFKKQRQTYSIAAIALIAARKDSPEAKQAMQQLCRHENPDIRAQAIYYLGIVFGYAERELSAEIQVLFREIAVQDQAFEPRFQARSMLRLFELPVPADPVDRVFAFRVRFLHAKRLFSVTIELLSEHTLEDLHNEIQSALQWDNDHLYSFYLIGKDRWTRDDRFRSPYEDEGPHTTEAVLGELGLTEKHKFLYLFDYGDGHKFEVQVVDILTKTEGTKYPRVVDRKGKPPRQYGRW